MKAKRTGRCTSSTCLDPNRGVIKLGDEITRASNNQWMHLRCARTMENAIPNCNKCGDPIVFHENRWRGICQGCCEELEAVVDWSPSLVQQWLQWDGLFLERAIMQLLDIQIDVADTKTLIRAAKWIDSGKHLDGWFLKDLRKRIVKYARQLRTIIFISEEEGINALLRIREQGPFQQTGHPNSGHLHRTAPFASSRDDQHLLTGGNK